MRNMRIIMLGVMIVTCLSNSYAADAELKRFIAASEYDVKKHGALYSESWALRLPLVKLPRCHTLDFHPDGSEVAIGTGNGTLTIFDLYTGDNYRLEGGGRPIMSLSYVPTGIVFGRVKEVVYCKISKAASKAGSVYSCEVEKLAQLTSKVLILKTQFQQRELVTGSEDGAYTMWDVVTGKVKRALVQAAAEPATALTYLSDNLVAVGAADNTIAMYDVRTDKPIKNLKTHKALVSSLAYDSERKRLLSASYDGIVAVWDPQCEHLHYTALKGSESPVLAVTSIPLAQTWSGDELLCGGMNGLTLRSDGVKTYHNSFTTHKARITAVASISRLQASVGYDGYLSLLGMLTKKMMTKFCLKTDQDCAVCLVPLQQAKDRVALCCTHNFHSSCITPWLTKNSTCPICRAPHAGEPLALSEEEGEKEDSAEKGRSKGQGKRKRQSDGK